MNLDTILIFSLVQPDLFGFKDGAPTAQKLIYCPGLISDLLFAFIAPGEAMAACDQPSVAGSKLTSYRIKAFKFVRENIPFAEIPRLLAAIGAEIAKNCVESLVESGQIMAEGDSKQMWQA